MNEGKLVQNRLQLRIFREGSLNFLLLYFEVTFAAQMFKNNPKRLRELK